MQNISQIIFIILQIAGCKEISALQIMVKSYTEKLKFGDVNKFHSELDKVTISFMT